MSHYKPYPAYKDSGVEWLGQVPAHWEVKRLKYSANHITEKTDRRESAIALENIESGTGRFVGTSSEFEGEGVAFKPGDILFGKLRPYLAKVYLATITGEAVGDVFVIRPSSQIYQPFLQYQLLSREFINMVDSSTYGAKMPRVSWEFFGDMPLLNPMREEQLAIAIHLDRETARIDGLVSRKTRFIELLREKRQALITHAVTKGLDPNAPMKNSGVEWLGDVPAHWNVTRVKYVISSIGQGWSPECESRPVDDGEWGVLKVGCVNGGVFRPTENKALPLTLAPKPELALKKGDVLVSRANTRELVGGCAVVEQDFPLLMICDKLYRLSVDNARTNPAFLAALIAVHGRREVELEATGASASMVNIAQSVILNLQVGLPPIDEQVAIIASVASGTQRYDTLISTTDNSIELLKERRSALITAAVTGKIDLRETA